MARFILVHGAWHGGWCWEEMVPRLKALGHEVSAPDLPGMGADAAWGHVATLEEWAMYIAGMASARDEPAILVGHSRGGIVVSRAAEIAPGAVRRLVYLAAMMPISGESMADIFERPESGHGPGIAAAVSVCEGGATMILHGREAALAAFYGTTPPDQAEAAFARLTPEPTAMRAARVILSDARYGSVPRTYIYCKQDQSVRPELQRYMVSRQPCDTDALDTDHSPFYSAPEELTAMLHGLATGEGYAG
ncbi:alpha/beta fold hydrolase [Sphingobium yanoikuyae]|uniref:AB hydrolase-1 domain-containing protein n=1 Tax=Sphingobium yanoikuyae TaxID=13690 RepID=A0A291N089_SPHYA|nr:alpha/beta fold hydrolase [Sphingobium yanoikuyae]ATI80759.1 hypothetical protein A6768_12665 [Sphingobium yanoikuyae]